MEGSSRPQHDDFVDRIVSDPSRPPEVAVFQGFVGASDREDHVRVYADLTLSAWVDLPAAAVLHAVRLPAEQSPAGGSVLLVDASATVRPFDQGEADEPTASDFLRGRVRDALGSARYGEEGEETDEEEESEGLYPTRTYYPNCPPSIPPACLLA
jgi:hypothetical protein